jgi:putative serine protease PepD
MSTNPNDTMQRSPVREPDPPEWIAERLHERASPHPATPVPGRPGLLTRMRNGRIAPLLIAAALLAGGYGIARVTDDSAPASAGAPPATQAPAPVRARGPEAVTAVAHAVLPSVVQLETATGLGSGIVYDKDGFILTAAHVVEGNSQITVRLPDGTRVPGDVVGADEGTDVAVVKMDRSGEPAVLATGSRVRVGQLAVAIGSPFGLEGTVTAGVVSAVNRTIPTDSGAVMSMIQTDAPINPGNSGGALVDRHGRVIGINDAIRSDSGVNAGVGFAIPIDTAASVAKSLVAGREPAIGFLGVSGTEPASGRPGALVTDVQPGTPADNAGLQPGDLITEFDGKAVTDMAALAGLVRPTPPGTTVTLEVVRGGRTEHIQVKVGRQ